jgi:hypothetical protein
MVASKSSESKTVNEAVELRPLLAAEVVPLELVDANGWYKVVIQIGANNMWRGCTGGRWVTDRVDEIDMGHGTPKVWKSHMRHVPQLHTARRLDGETVNGLIGEHNLWLGANQACGPRPRMFDDEGRINEPLLRGNISRQLLVVSIEPDDAPQQVEDSRRLHEIAAVCKAVIAGLVESGVIGPNANTNAKGK